MKRLYPDVIIAKYFPPQKCPTCGQIGTIQLKTTREKRSHETVPGRYHHHIYVHGYYYFAHRQSNKTEWCYISLKDYRRLALPRFRLLPEWRWKLVQEKENASNRVNTKKGTIYIQYTFPFPTAITHFKKRLRALRKISIRRTLLSIREMGPILRIAFEQMIKPEIFKPKEKPEDYDERFQD